MPGRTTSRSPPGVLSGDFHCADLNGDGTTCYSAQTLAVTAVVDYDRIEKLPPDGMIYHPVRDFDTWLAQADKRIAALVTNTRLSPSKAVRADASFQSGVALACSQHPKHRGIALAPLMVAHALWNARPWAAKSLLNQVAADKHQAEQCQRMLERQFGVTPARRPLGTVHLAACQGPADTLSTAAPGDFELGPGFQIGRFPRRAALPFIYDLERRELLLTLHLRPYDLLHAPFLYAEQRGQARVIARLPLAALPEIYGPPNRQSNRC